MERSLPCFEKHVKLSHGCPCDNGSAVMLASLSGHDSQQLPPIRQGQARRAAARAHRGAGGGAGAFRARVSSGADIAALCSEAAMTALRRHVASHGTQRGGRPMQLCNGVRRKATLTLQTGRISTACTTSVVPAGVLVCGRTSSKTGVVIISECEVWWDGPPVRPEERGLSDAVFCSCLGRRSPMKATANDSVGPLLCMVASALHRLTRHRIFLIHDPERAACNNHDSNHRHTADILPTQPRQAHWSTVVHSPCG